MEWWNMPCTPPHPQRARARARNQRSRMSPATGSPREAASDEVSWARAEVAEARIRQRQARIDRFLERQQRHRGPGSRAPRVISRSVENRENRVANRSIANRNNRLTHAFEGLIEQLGHENQRSAPDSRAERDYDSLASLMSQVNLTRRAADGTVENISGLFSHMTVGESSSSRHRDSQDDEMDVSSSSPSRRGHDTPADSSPSPAGYSQRRNGE